MKNSKKKPTAIDVARLAGVSRTQVSYVLNNNRLDHVSTENQAKIKKAAEELGYQPLASAQNLRRGYTKEFCIFFPAPYSPRINNLIGSIHEEGLCNDFSPTQYSFNSYKNEERKMTALNHMLNNKPFGVFCSPLDLTDEDIDCIQQSGVKKILLWDIKENPGIPTIIFPTEKAGHIVGEYIKSKNLKRIGVIKPEDPIQQKSFDMRLKGLKTALESCSAYSITVIEWEKGVFRPDILSARKVTDKIQNLKDKIDVLYAYSDDYAIPLISCLKNAGYKLPGDLSIIGTDNLKYGEMMSPSLTTISFDSGKLSEKAMGIMNALIKNEEIDPELLKPVEPQLIVRGSC